MIKRNIDNNKIKNLIIKPRFKAHKHIIVFVHGFNSKSEEHIKFFKKLTWGKEKNIIYSFDFPNHGESRKEENYKFDDYVSFFIKWFNKQNFENIILVGHSMGGGIIAKSYEQIKDKVKAIILEDPINISIFKEVKKRSINLLNKDKRITPIEKVKNLYEWFVPNNKQFKKLFKSMINPINILSISSKYSKIDKPVLILSGENDYFVPVNTTFDFFSKNIKNSSIVKIKNAGHTPFVENTKDSIEIVRNFLKNI